MGLDYYQILGVQRNASVDEIKRAYRRLALIWHPDKNAENRQEAEVKFKLISEAYEVLRDPSKRTIFDRFGEEGLRQGPTSNPTNSNFTGASSSFGRFHDPNEVFREFFGTSSIFDLFERMNNNANTGFGGGSGFRDPFFDDPFFSSVGIGSSSGAGGGAGMTRSNFGMSNPFFPDFFSGDQGQGHRIGMRSSQKSIEIVNGQRTVTTITTDEQGNQTITRELPDGRVETSSSNISTKSEPKRIK